MLKNRRSNGPKLKKAPDHTQAPRESASRTIPMLPEDSEDVQLVLECMVDIYRGGQAKAGVYGEYTAESVVELLDKVAKYLKKINA